MIYFKIINRYLNYIMVILDSFSDADDEKLKNFDFSDEENNTKKRSFVKPDGWCCCFVFILNLINQMIIV